MELTPGEITYLMQLVSEDIVADLKVGIAEEMTVGRREIFAKLERTRDETRETVRLLQKLERITLEHQQMLEIIEQERRFILQ